MSEEYCVICKEQINLSERKSFSVLSSVGCSTINKASNERCDNLTTTEGQKVHPVCRTNYVSKKSCAAKKRKKSDSSEERSKICLRSEETFNFRNNCLFCINVVTTRQKERRTAYQVMSKFREFDKSVLQICEKRADDLAQVVKGRLAFVIEQVLMRSLKSVGGMTHGRGMTELQRSLWLLSTPACAEINKAMQSFTDILYEGGEQHKDATKSRLDKDYQDAILLMRYLIERNPFN